MAKAKLQYVRIDSITEGTRYREELEIDSLVESVREKGIIQPITLTKDLILIAGGRRLAAARSAGMLEIPAILRENRGEVDLREIELMENIERKDLLWWEKVKITRSIHDLKVDEIDASPKNGHPWTQKDTAGLLKKSEGKISRELFLAGVVEKMPEIKKAATEDEAARSLKKLSKKIVAENDIRQQEKTLAKGKNTHISLGQTAPGTGAGTGAGNKLGPGTIYEMASANYQQGDALAGMQRLVETYKDMPSPISIIEVDPPYGINLHEAKRTVDKDLGEYEEVESDQYPEFLKRLSELTHQIAGRDCWMIFWYGPTWVVEVRTALLAAGWQLDDIPGIWTKNQGQTNQPDIYFGRSYEPFFMCRKGKPHFAKAGHLNVFPCTPDKPTDKIHPTQRPVALIEEILNCLGYEKSIVCCPFMGSGNTWMAAYQAGMRCFGWDLSGEFRPQFLAHIKKMDRQAQRPQEKAK